MTERKYKLIKRLLEKAYDLLLDDNVTSGKQEYAEIKVKTRSVLLKLKKNHLHFISKW